MFEDIKLIIHHGILAADKQQRFAVVEHTHLIGCHQLAPCVLIVGGIVAAVSTALAVGVGINGCLAEKLGHIFVFQTTLSIVQCSAG